MKLRPSAFAFALYLIACGTPAPPLNGGASPVRDAAAVERDSLGALVREAIAGHETEPATEIFENIQVLNEGMSAANFVQAMTLYSSALGVGCSHCHTIGNWVSDEKPKKAVTRAMIRMNGVINGQIKSIPDLRTANPSVTCLTCHRGQAVPPK